MNVKEFRKKFKPESQEQVSCVQLLEIAKCVIWRNNVGAMKVPDKNKGHRYVRFGQKGHPDIVGYKMGDGMFVCWEVKRAGGRVRPEQKKFIEEAKRGGAFAGIGTADDLEKQLKDYGWL